MDDKLRIRVTKDDIALGEANNVTRCPIARAINRTHPDLTWAWVQVDRIGVSNTEERLRYFWTPTPKVQAAIHTQDNGEGLRPFTFTLDPSQATTKPMKSRAKQRNLGPPRVSKPRTAEQNRKIRGHTA